MSGQRKTLMWDALSDALGSWCTTEQMSAVVLRRLSGTHPSHAVVAAAGRVASHLSPDEPVDIHPPHQHAATSARRSLEISSYLRPHRLLFRETTSWPLHIGSEQYVLVVGSGETLTRQAQLDTVALQAELLHWHQRVASLRHHDLDEGYRLVAEASATVDSAHTHEILLACTRRLLESDAAYLGVPADDRYFVFSHTQGILTKNFQRLRVGVGEGLGGHVRVARRATRSIDYDHDTRFDVQIRQTTLREGLYSAAAAPVMEGRTGPVEAVLYVANRKPMAYSIEEEALLGEFAQAALLALRSAESEEERQRVVRERELIGVTQQLHDSLGRQFTQALYLVQEIGSAVGPETRQRFDELSEVLVDASAHLRQHLDTLHDRTRQEALSIRVVAATTQEVPSLGQVRRTVSFDQDWLAGVVVPGPVGLAMVQAGQEAVYNAELHSNGNNCGVTFTAVSGAIMMTVTDDGQGINRSLPGQTHIGTQLMKRATASVGGTLNVSTSPAGTVVQLTFPVNEVESRSSAWPE